MTLKKDYSRSIALRCMTCGATYAFETDEKAGYVVCHKCNRMYMGGYDELVRLNEALIEDEKELMLDEIKKDIGKELQKILGNITIKL